ncbi:unnamed protein product [Blepharisma stoltei]|uniref:Uncharacterized protein n=1 Tax=Blepharisma stoltei TaxID=1481888 RepID=A0AAU9I9N7_9CILI|nr:unnamed protein product [Blepharisma stoltei]
MQNNRKLEALLRNLCYTSVCKEVFKNIIIEEDESIFEAKLTELFNYVAENSYYAHLPKGLHGVTAIGCKIFISSKYLKKIEDEEEEKKEKEKEEEKEEEKKEEKKEAKKVNELEVRLRRDLKKLEDRFRWSPTLKILLHEIAVLSTRFWEQQTSYFRIAPREYINPSNPRKSYKDIGDYLESLLFGDRLKSLYRGGAEILLNIHNWNLPIDRFQSKFLEWQEDSKAYGGNFYLLWSRKIEANCVTFGRCGMSYLNSR